MLHLTRENIFTMEAYPYQQGVALSRNLDLCDIIKSYDYTTGLDMCCGRGIIGLSLLSYNAIKRCDFTDILQRQVEICINNVKTLELEEKSSVYQSDVWENITNKYDLIIANPPWWPYKVDTMMRQDVYEEAWLDKDWKWHVKFFKGILEHLNPGGRALLVEGGFASHVSIYEPYLTGMNYNVFQTIDKTTWIMEIINE